MPKAKEGKGKKTKQSSKSKTKADASRAEAHAKAAAATLPEADRQHKSAPGTSDIRRRYLKSLLGDYMSAHRGAPAIKPKK
jgi:hypothetical protein